MSYENHPGMRRLLQDEGPIGEVPAATDDWIRARISHVLLVYPKLSMSMLQVGVGTSLSSAVWKPVLHQMANEGLVTISNATAITPEGRTQTYTIISLSPEYLQKVRSHTRTL